MSKEVPSDKLVFLDVETSGLNPVDGILLEVGFRVTDLDLNELDRFSAVVGWGESAIKYAMDKAPDILQEMHRNNDLWRACADAPLAEFSVDALASSWAESAGIKGYPLAGSSLRLDREFLEAYMPKTAALFHYRSIDNSSTKELCRRYNPDLYAQVPVFETDHRVNTCLDGTISEFKFYLDNFIFDGRGDPE